MIAKQFIKIRREMGLTQIGLAKELGRSHRYITSREIGEKPISKELEGAVMRLHEQFKNKPQPKDKK